MYVFVKIIVICHQCRLKQHNEFFCGCYCFLIAGKNTPDLQRKVFCDNHLPRNPTNTPQTVHLPLSVSSSMLNSSLPDISKCVTENKESVIKKIAGDVNEPLKVS